MYEKSPEETRIQRDAYSSVPESHYLFEPYRLLNNLENAAANCGLCKGGAIGFRVKQVVDAYEEACDAFDVYILSYAPSFSGRAWRAVKSLLHRSQKAAYYRAKWQEYACWDLESVDEARVVALKLLAKYVVVH
jgi:hypothetical protein